MGSTSARALRVGAAWVAMLGAVLTCTLPPVPPGQDAPPHIVAAAVLAQPELFCPWFEVGRAATGDVFELAVAALAGVVPLFAAARLVLTLLVVALALGCGAAARAVGGSWSAGCALGAAYAVGWAWGMGFYNFNVAFAVGIWAVPLLFPGAAASRGRRVVAAIVLLAAARAHIIGAGMLLVELLALRVLMLRDHPGRRGRVLAVDALTAAPAAAYAAYWFTRALGGASRTGRTESVGTTTGSLASTVVDLATTTFGAFTPLGWVLAAAALGALTVAAFDERRRRTALLALAWLTAMAAIPLHGLGWHFARPRCGFFALALGAAVVPEDRRRLTPLVLALAAAVVVWAGVPGAVAEGRRADAAAESFGTRPSGRTLEVVYGPEPTVPSAPYIRSGIGLAHYATLAGGAVAGAFATHPVTHPLRFRGGMAAVFPGTSVLGVQVPAACMGDHACWTTDLIRGDRIAQVGTWWDSVAVVGAPPGVLERLAERGFTGDAPGLLFPHPSTVDLALPPGTRGPVAWAVAFPATLGVVLVDGGDVNRDGVRVRMEHLPAGPVRVVLVADTNGNRAVDGGDPLLFDSGTVRLPPDGTLNLPVPQD